MADRFENGDPTNDTGGIAGDSLVNGLDPTHPITPICLLVTKPRRVWSRQFRWTPGSVCSR
jgi:hypothetical protein